MNTNNRLSDLRETSLEVMTNQDKPAPLRRQLSRLEFCSSLATAGLLLTGLMGTAGCGGGSGDLSRNGTGRATFTITWPEPSRLIPSAANSIVISILRIDGSVLATRTLSRPPGGGTSTAAFEGLPPGSLNVTADARPGADGTGVTQASAASPVTISVNQTASLSLTLGSTIDRLEAAPPTLSLAAGGSSLLVVTAKNRTGDIVLIDPAKLKYESYIVTDAGRSDTSPIASVDSTGRVTAGDAPGDAAIQITETESGKNATVAVKVSAPAGRPISQKYTSFQIDAAHSGGAIFGQPLSFPNEKSWVISSSAPGFHTLIIADGRVFVLERSLFNTILFAYDLKTGKNLWVYDNSQTNHWGPVSLTYDNGVLIAGLALASSPTVIVGIDPATGTVRWRFGGVPNRDSPTIPVAVDGTVYFTTASHPWGPQGARQIHQRALDSAAGTPRWERQLTVPQDGFYAATYAPTVSTDDGLVYFNRANALDAVSLADGTLVWESNLKSQGIHYFNTHALHEGKLYTQAMDSQMRTIGTPPVLDSRTGSQSGTYPWASEGYPSGTRTHAFSKNIRLKTGTFGVEATDINTGQTLWTSPIRSDYSPIFIDDTAFVAGFDNRVHALERTTGKEIWRSDYAVGVNLAAGEGYLIVIGSNLSAYHLAGPK